MRSNTSKSMLSQAWSTSELKDGIAHLLADGETELPDDLEQLEEDHLAANLPYDHLVATLVAPNILPALAWRSWRNLWPPNLKPRRHQPVF